jgi:hypothetical protein
MRSRDLVTRSYLFNLYPFINRAGDVSSLLQFEKTNPDTRHSSNSARLFRIALYFIQSITAATEGIADNSENCNAFFHLKSVDTGEK